MKNNTKGFLYYAHNNEEINYLKLAICSALSGFYYVNDFQASIVTDDISLKYTPKKDVKLIEKLFQDIKIDNDFYSKVKAPNMKTIFDVYENKGNLPWHNKTRPNAYNDSIYDETLLIDVDYIFQNSDTDKIWGSLHPLKMNRKVIPTVGSSHQKNFMFSDNQLIGSFSIPQYWATVVYFQKNNFCKTFFNLVNHIKENYNYYSRIYQIDNKLYRNDYTFSIALHIMNGYKVPNDEFNLPFNYVLLTHMDSIYHVENNCTKFIIHVRGSSKPWQPLKLEGLSYHAMNKVDMLRNYEKYLEAYK